jgi:hypothetical protein
MTEAMRFDAHGLGSGLPWPRAVAGIAAFAERGIFRCPGAADVGYASAMDPVLTLRLSDERLGEVRRELRWCVARIILALAVYSLLRGSLGIQESLGVLVLFALSNVSRVRQSLAAPNRRLVLSHSTLSCAGGPASAETIALRDIVA